MTLDELIKFHEREFKDEKSKRVTLGDDLTYKATAYAQTLNMLRSHDRTQRQLVFLLDRIDFIIEELHADETVPREALYQWSGKVLREMEAIV